MNTDKIIRLLRSSQVKVTPQRIAVYNYLCDNPTHPDADEIYREVVSENPSFSKTTVYNSLQALVDSGLVIRIDIDDDRKRFDARTESHGHFRCVSCGGIYDFEVIEIKYSGIDNFSVTNKQLYFSGYCNRCKNIMN